jgi:Tfp pilus assembly PilM family ATPase
MKNGSTTLSIFLSGDTIRFIEAEDWNGTINITNVAKTPLPKKFDFSVIGDDDYVPQIADLIDKTLETFSVDVMDARVCIDRRLALKKNFAIDKGLTDDEIRQHIEWELEQVLIAPRDEYNVDYLCTTLIGSKKDVVVFAAIRTAIVKYLRDIFQKSKVSMQTMDLDLFAAVRALTATTNELSGAHALVDFSPSGIGVTCLLDGAYTLSVDLPTVVDDKRFEDWSTDVLAATIDQALQKVIENVEENFRVVDLQTIFLSGPLPHSSLVDELAGLRPDSDVKVFEPFGQVHKQLNIESQTLIDEQGEEFIACLGMIV